jgi:hypothetical protein
MPELSASCRQQYRRLTLESQRKDNVTNPTDKQGARNCDAMLGRLLDEMDRRAADEDEEGDNETI